MIRFFYTLIYYFCAPILCLRWIYKSIKPPQYREPFRQRFGIVTPQKTESIWFHAVSMGEAAGAVSIINQLLKKDPDLNIVITTTTPTGAKVVQKSLSNSKNVSHYFSPCDLPGTIKRFVKSIKPKLVIIMETELWPNWIHYLSGKSIPVILANARLSERSAKRYAYYAKTIKRMLNQLSLILSVGKDDGQRYLELGLQKNKLKVIGNIKYDAEYPKEINSSYFTKWKGCPVWIAASTHDGEDQIILAAHKKVVAKFPNTKLIIVPRHPERFEEVESLIKENGFKYSRRSQPNSWDSESEVLLGDSMGELMQAYSLSDIAFIGGSLTNVGGHNGMEPALLAKPILTGPYIRNFQYLFENLIQNQAALMINNEHELSERLNYFLKNPNEAESMGARAKELIIANRGALNKTVTIIQKYLTE